MLVNVILDGLAYLIAKLGHKGIIFICHFLTFLIFDVLRIRRKVMLNNLNIALKDTKKTEEKILIARASVFNFLRTIFEFIGSRRLFPHIELTHSHPEHVWNALAQQKGMYAMCIHLGNWELMCSTGTKFFCPIHVVVKNIGKGKVGEWVKKLRSHIGFFIIDRNKEKNATHQIFEMLNKNHIVAFMADQRRKGRGEKIPFFGVPCHTNDSLMKLWLRHPVPIIPVYIHRISDNHHEMVYLPEFKPVQKPEWSQSQTIRENTLLMNLLIEKVILKYPEEYFWMHQRWKD